MVNLKKEICKGIVKFYNSDKKFGFITNEETNSEIFFHYGDFQNKSPILESNLILCRKGKIMKVEFVCLTYYTKLQQKTKAIQIHYI